MIIVFKQNATVEEKTKLKNQLESKGFQIHASDGVNAYCLVLLVIPALWISTFYVLLRV